MRLAVVVVFLNEEAFLPRLLASVASQTRAPDRLLLVDDGSADASPTIARDFAERHPYAEVLLRARGPRAADRLAAAAELLAFQSGAEHLRGEFDVIAKMDGDLELPAELFEQVMNAFAGDARLGIAGASLAVANGDGSRRRERNAPWHVRGATKFYRQACLSEISPLPAILGWDTIDEARAEMRGWHVRSVEVSGSDALHLRQTGTYDGAIRGYRRRGVAAWGYGADPLNVLASALVRALDRPLVIGATAYLWGWVHAAIRRAPRAEADVRRFVRRQQRRRLWEAVAHGGRW